MVKRNKRFNLVGKSKTLPVVYTFLFLILVFHAVNNYIWLALDNFPFGADELGHLENGITVSRIMRDPLGLFTLETVFPHKLGPLHYFTSLALVLFFGYSHLAFMMTATAFFILLLTVVYLIGKELKDASTGLLAAFILSMYPIVFHFSRKYSYEMAMMATVALSIYSLFKINNFERRNYSLLLGLSIGLGFLAGPRTFIFVAGPLTYILIKAFMQKSPFSHKRRFFNITLTSGIGIFCADGRPPEIP